MTEDITREIPAADKGRAPGPGEYIAAALVIVLTAAVVIAFYGKGIRTRFEKLGAARTQPAETKTR